MEEIQNEPLTIGTTVNITKPYIDETTGFDMSGFTGVIRLIFEPEKDGEPTFYLIEWSANTLLSMPDDYILKCFDNEIGWSSGYVPENVLSRMPVPHDVLKTEWAKNDISAKLLWEELGREGRMIKKVFSATIDRSAAAPIQCWYEYLENELTFPVKGMICYEYEDGDGPLRLENRIAVTGLSGYDTPLGIMADVTFDGREYIIPLQDIECSETSKGGRIVNSYGIWMICRS